MTIESIQNENREKKYRGSMIIIPHDNFVQQNICNIGISEGEKREKGRDKYLKNHSQNFFKIGKNC